MIRKLYYYLGREHDPLRNLALEEYLTATVPAETCILYLWQNAHTVVIGRNQNAWQECRTALLQQEGGVLARRLSGGGAVYHDLGNLNFTFSLRAEDYDLRRQQTVLLEACRSLGVEAELSGRNDILAGGRKFSGNSFYSHAGRAFHNGTLLLDVDMENLGRYLNPSQVKLESKGVSSVRSRVVNLAELVPGLGRDAMEQALVRALGQVYGLTPQPLRAGDFDRDALEAGYQRFHSDAWIYGERIPFTASLATRFDWGEITLQLRVEGGRVREAAVYTDALDERFAHPLAERLRGCPFTAAGLCAAVEETPACAAVAGDLCRFLRQQDI